MAPPTLETLPVLVIDHICSHLPAQSVKHLRLTCTTLAHLTAARDAFPRLLSAQTTNLLPESLERLSSLADHEHLRHGVRKLTVNAAVPDPSALSNHRELWFDGVRRGPVLGREMHVRWRTPEAQLYVEQVAEEQRHMATTNLDMQTLAYAFERFTRLSTVALGLDCLEDPDADGNMETRTETYTDPGTFPSMDGDAQRHVQEHLARALDAVLHATLQSGAQLKTLHLYSDDVPSLDILTLRTCMRSVSTSHLERAFRGLTSLSLSVAKSHPDPAAVPAPDMRDAVTWPGRIAGLCAASLENLTLDVAFGESYPSGWQPDVFASFSTIEFPALTVCNICNVVAAAPDFLAFLSHVPALEALDVVNLTLVKRSIWAGESYVVERVFGPDNEADGADAEDVARFTSVMGMVAGPDRGLRRLMRLCLWEVEAHGQPVMFQYDGRSKAYCTVEGESLDAPLNTPGGLCWSLV